MGKPLMGILRSKYKNWQEVFFILCEYLCIYLECSGVKYVYYWSMCDENVLIV